MFFTFLSILCILIKTKANVIGALLEELMELIQVRNLCFFSCLALTMWILSQAVVSALSKTWTICRISILEWPSILKNDYCCIGNKFLQILIVCFGVSSMFGQNYLFRFWGKKSTYILKGNHWTLWIQLLTWQFVK